MAEWSGGGSATAGTEAGDAGDGDADGGEAMPLPLELRPAVEAFLLGATQWRWLTIGDRPVRVGLDYAALQAAVGLAQLDLGPEDFDGVRIMEAFALKFMARG